MSQVVGQCMYCNGSIVDLLGSGRTVCLWCEDAPRRVALVTRVQQVRHNNYCAAIHRIFADLARRRGDTETATARELRASALAQKDDA